MDDNSRDRLTLARRFLDPSNSTHRQYEALRAFFVDGVPSAEAAARFGYTPGSFRVLVHQFRNQSGRDFFVSTARQGRPPGKQKRLREQVVALRKQNLSVHDISRALAREGEPLSPAAVAAILEEEGFAKLPRRRRAARPAPSRRGRSGRRPSARPDATPLPYQVRRSVPVPAVAGLGRPGQAPRAGWFPRLEDGPGRVRRAVAAGAEALRQRRPQPRHEFGPRRGAGPVRRVERGPEAVVLDRIQRPRRPGLLPEVDAQLVRRGQPPGPEMGDVLRPRLPHDPLPRRRRPGRETLRLEAEPSAEGDAGVPGPRRRDPRLLLRQRRAAQGPAER